MAEGDPEPQICVLEHKRIQRRRFIRVSTLIFFVTICFVGLTLWLVYHPTNPKFRVVNATVYGQNESSPSQVTMQFTIAAKNPNLQASIYYDNLTTFVLCRDGKLTEQVALASLFQEKQSTALMSPSRAMAVENRLVMRRGGVWLRIVLLGRIGWKLELFITSINIRYYALDVNCDIFVDSNAELVGLLSLLHSSLCRVDIQ